MDYRIVFNCFHGTIKHYSDTIMSERKFIIKRRNNHWLGNGVYFFLNDPDKAEWWAKEAASKAVRNGVFARNSVSAQKSVIYIEATALSTEVLDLDTEGDQKILDNFIKHLGNNKFKIVGNRSINSESSDDHEMLCSILDLFVLTEEYMASCYTFESTQRTLFQKLSYYGVFNKSRQLCIYDQSIIDFNSLKVL